MSLRNINHQAAIELDELDTEYVAGLKQEREQLQQSLDAIKLNTLTRPGINYIKQRLARIEELLA